MRVNYKQEGNKFFDNETLEKIDNIMINYSTNEGIQPYLVRPGGKAEKFDTIYKQINIPSRSKMLEFGPGSGYAIYMGLLHGFDMWGIDIDQIKIFGIQSFDMIQKTIGVQDRIRFYDGVNEFPFEDNEFDCFIANNSLHHIKTITGKWVVNGVQWSTETVYKKRFEEISRVMKENSKLYVKGNRAKLAQHYLNNIGNPKNLKVMCYAKGEILKYKGKETLNYFKNKKK